MDVNLQASPNDFYRKIMKIFVTGSTGFIGAQLCMALATMGHKVHALYRSVNKTSGIIHPNITLFQGDILDEKSIIMAMKGCSQVYHTAAFTGVWAKDFQDIYRLNVLGTLVVLEAALKNNVRDLVVTSTAGVFGPSSKGQVDENSESLNGYFTEYERTKALSQVKAMEYLDAGLNIRIVNPTRVFGPGRLSQSNSVTKIIMGYAKGSWRIIPGNGRQIANYAFAEDVVKGHILAMEKGKAGELYILGGHNISYNNLFESLAQVTGKKRLMINLPLTLMMWLAKIAENLWTIAGITPFITTGLVRKYNHHWNVSSLKATEDLGYTITPFKKALEITLSNSEEGQP